MITPETNEEWFGKFMDEELDDPVTKFDCANIAWVISDLTPDIDQALAYIDQLIKALHEASGSREDFEAISGVFAQLEEIELIAIPEPVACIIDRIKAQSS